MPKNKLTEYSATNASNTDVGGVNIDEGMLPSAVNNSIRELMTHLKNFSDGTDAIDALEVTGDLTVDTNTLHVDAANNRVGVGLTTPERVLHVNAGTNNNCALFESTDANADIYLQDSGATGNTSVGLRGQSNDLVLITNGSETARLLSGGGLTFNGDTAAANAIDDYEEGTWTPSVGGSATYTIQAGHYTKIGNQVFITGSVLINSISGAAHTNYLDGLPYQSVTGNGREGHISVHYFASMASTGTYFALRANGDRLYGSAQRENDNTMAINPDIFQNSTEVTFGGSYFTS